ncbi:histone-lysine N-methyltransferase ASHR2 [Phragmites australis]|uniref:histone-lysine N-methyltransferase ASHR2 n=1 Tax=Phragmites australis TaxID=29695 RepID=UPI002D78EE0B|nr:histone-lysine N-methyltransferase ASHR2 [Phragmites australis]XP_062195986.1 histone-lysine N-methyltransferase ASHR2 [Phragmites australis]XP_062195987.1 histone-lysine N-methyltransferase ASHR2 [Phragmites australis]XP_062195988.1 histone-lysine N-methyltransferase ASHR2 [Phragmites australis]XP_062195990.1 histone-lysine N-methyltransferase ASHR2 [Phragmites australis]
MASAPRNPTATAAGNALRVADLPGRGRGLVVARNVLQGEVLLSEPPILIYPATLASLPSYCSACFRSLPAAAAIACASCRAAAFCSPACAAASHPRLLCAALSNGGGAALAAAAPTEAVQEPLLFLLSAYSLPEPSLRTIISLSSAPPPPPGAQDAAGLHAAVAALVPPHMLLPGFSPDLTVALLAKDRGNSFAVMEPYRPGMSLELLKARAYAVYPRASLFNHDCLPNACHFDYPDRPGPGNTNIVVRALHDIPEGSEICISYFAANWSYADRQRRLLEDYGFRCECDRCQVESLWKHDDDNDGGDGDDIMEEEGEENGGDGGDGMEEGDGGDDSDVDFPHAYFFVRFLCDIEGCWGMLAPLPPSPNGQRSDVFECNLCGKLRKEEDALPNEGTSGMVQ